MEIGKDLKKAIYHLESGNLVAIPTETVYGLAANGLDENAVLKIFKAKSRPAFNPLILHCADAAAAETLTTGFSDTVRKLVEAFWPGPLTIVLEKAPHVPMLVTAGMDTVALRVPAHPLTLELLSKLKFPLAAPSANRSGSVSPTLPETVAKSMQGKVDYILDGGQCMIGLESTIVGFDSGKTVLLRYGGISPEDIERETGEKIEIAKNETPIKSPGMLKSHYAPDKKVITGTFEALMNYIKKHPGIYAALTFTTPLPGIALQNQRVLSSEGSLQEAARNLFIALHELDKTDADVILAEFLPNHSIGYAINDRLTRASAPRN